MQHGATRAGKSIGTPVLMMHHHDGDAAVVSYRFRTCTAMYALEKRKKKDIVIIKGN